MKDKNIQIIVEGTDGTGKTTLSKILAIYYDIDYVHFTEQDPKDYNFYSHTMRKQNIVYDRHFIGEIVYGEIFRKKSMLSQEDLLKLFVQAQLQNTIIILCHLPIQDNIELLEERDGRLSKNECCNLFLINKKYESIYKQYHNNLIIFNPLKDDIHELYKKINERLMRY